MHADAVLMTAAVTWAEQHPPESIDEAATWITPGGDTGLTLAGPGAPLVAEFCIAEFALAIGRSTDGGRALVAAAVELKYRLPRVWARVQSGDLEAWRARRIADETFGLSVEAAAFVDAQVAPFAHRIGIAALGAADRRGDRPVHARQGRRGRREGRGHSALHDRPPAGLLRRHQPDQRRARPRRRPRPRRRRREGRTRVAHPGVDGLTRRASFDRGRSDRPQPGRPWSGAAPTASCCPGARNRRTPSTATRRSSSWLLASRPPTTGARGLDDGGAGGGVGRR